MINRKYESSIGYNFEGNFILKLYRIVSAVQIQWAQLRSHLQSRKYLKILRRLL